LADEPFAAALSGSPDPETLTALSYMAIELSRDELLCADLNPWPPYVFDDATPWLAGCDDGPIEIQGRRCVPGALAKRSSTEVN
jgi:hypothetical protein